jgi:prepilin-type processing-associated H-X9-DG protein
VKTWLVVLALLAGLVYYFLLKAPEAVGSLLFGWLLFLERVVSRMTVDWGTVTVSLTALILFTAGVHAAGRAWRRTAERRPAWKLRWSAAAVAILFVLFAAGVALVGIVHQVGWLATSPEPFRVQTVRGHRGYSTDNLREIAFALSNYHDLYRGLPPGGSFTPDGFMLHSWETQILVFIGYSQTGIDLKAPWNDPHNTPYFQSVLPVFLNRDLPVNDVRDTEGYGLSHYAANVWVMGPNRGLKLMDIPDGTANTLLAGEVNAHFQPWGHPVNWRDPAKGVNRSPHGFGGAPGKGGANFVMADGSVRFVSEKVSSEVLRALGTPDGGEQIDEATQGPSR